ncbi:hypothetical protein WISP_104306 [Willisornis vidua]|uniref:Uncharacterized protein n=1 Tax=Willisornis vidua TaxID=1566151 RepID=A0ABQ9D204_9PASS|nr:hypothetical protein WISP_104306 [Willisornis vidua]
MEPRMEEPQGPQLELSLEIMTTLEKGKVQYIHVVNVGTKVINISNYPPVFRVFVRLKTGNNQIPGGMASESKKSDSKFLPRLLFNCELKTGFI